MISFLLDSSAFYALADQHDKWHEEMVRAVESEPGDRVVPVTVLPEACDMIGTHLGPAAERRLVRAAARGAFLWERVGLSDLTRAGRALEKDAGADFGLVDASIVAIAERLTM